jgi:hypothetical protein
MSLEDVPIAGELPRGRVVARAYGRLFPDHHPDCRWTLQYFSDAEHLLQLQHKGLVPHNTDLLVPQSLDDWPTDSIFDMLYGCVVLKRWGQREAIETLLEISQEYKNEISSPKPQSNEVPKEEDCCMEERGDESRCFAVDSAGDMLGSLSMFQCVASQREQGSLKPPQPACTQDVEMKVLDWLEIQ